MSSGSFDLLGRLVNLLVTVSQWWGALVDLAEKLNSKSSERWGRELSMFLRKEPTWVSRWYEENGVIYFEVTSDDTTGPQWIERLEKKGFQLTKWAKEVLLSPDFKPTNGVIYRIAVLKGTMFAEGDRTTRKIRAEADKRKFTKPEAELGCLIRDLFTDEEIEAMGLVWIVAFHEPIKVSDGGLRLLGANRYGGGPWLHACCDEPDRRWGRYDGFAFVVSQVSSV